MLENKDFERLIRTTLQLVGLTLSLALGVAVLLTYYTIDPQLSAFKVSATEQVGIPVTTTTEIVDGIHVKTGLKDAEGLKTVIRNCTNCHSSKLIIQNRMNAERWNATIRWMQETQNLWPLGDQQEIIVNYLVTNYPPKAKGRRENLTNIDWYELED